MSSTGRQANNDSFYSSLSQDGAVVAFDSDASNLVSGDTNRAEDVFVRDRAAGTTERVSVSSTGAQANDICALGSLSASGEFVAFDSDASNLVPGDTNGAGDVLVRDRSSGRTERVSVTSLGRQGRSNSSGGSISDTGRFVAFDSINLTGNVYEQIYVHDRHTGRTRMVSKSSAGQAGNFYSYAGVISADGSAVTFFSDATNLVPGDTNGATDVFIHL